MPPSIDPSIEGGTPQIFTQSYLAGLSQASHLLGDETTGRAVVADPRRDVAEYGEA